MSKGIVKELNKCFETLYKCNYEITQRCLFLPLKYNKKTINIIKQCKGKFRFEYIYLEGSDVVIDWDGNIIKKYVPNS